jgi:preprotein translocase SecE subunit
MVGVGLAALLGWMFTRTGFSQWLVRVEEAGWFHATSFKPNQGLRVRRGTLIGLLIVGVCGIITLIQHRSLSAGAWEMVLPFTDTGTHVRVLPIMFHVEMTLPVLLAVGLVWFCWRTVNWPAFADFLIATEAEMNKVSWTTRKRLYQDTIVVLVAVVLMTTFLFVVDIIWIKALNFTGVLNVDLQEERAKQNAPTQW